jgi:hypothetical protein
VVPGGVITKSYVLLSKRVAFFGSGNTSVNVSAVIRNKADLRNAQIDIVAVGRRGWGYDEGFNKLELKKKWGTVAGPATTGWWKHSGGFRATSTSHKKACNRQRSSHRAVLHGAALFFCT